MDIAIYIKNTGNNINLEMRSKQEEDIQNKTIEEINLKVSLIELKSLLLDIDNIT